MRMTAKIAIVTGAGSGFGVGIAKRLAAEGAAVVVGDINLPAAEKTAAEIQAAGGRALAAGGDVSTRAGNEALVRAAVETFGGLDCFIANAGITHRNKPLLEVTEEEIDRIHAVNVKGVVLGAQAAVPALRQRGGGTFIVTASTAALRPRPGLVVYNGSKGATVTMVKSMALEFAPDKIRVHALCPVLGQTGLTADFIGGDTPENKAKFIATVPLGRMSTPEDLAAAALFLASDEAEFLTGIALEVDGGRCL
jgi:3-oxoacyl-[acyl-carrier protein] reductase